MAWSDFADRVAGVAVLAEPIRRDLYLFVVAQSDPVSRDQASDGLGLPRHTAKFHLDRLVQEGLLDTEFRRLSDRSGPGAGRPTKLYKRSDRQLAVTIPERRYDLAGELLASAIDVSARDGSTVAEALHDRAAEFGKSLGEVSRARSIPGSPAESEQASTYQVLADYGYEPRQEGEGLVLKNCPFHSLAREHTNLVCGMNLDILTAFAESTGERGLRARLDPGPDRCCVVLSES